jgi:DnaJ-class molecular chaperone
MKKLILLTISIFTLASSVCSQTLHAIIFADTKDKTIGYGCEKAYNIMAEEAEIISKKTGLQLRTYFYKGDDCKKDKAESIVKSLNCSTSDIVLFFFSGHGYNRSADSNLPTIVFRGVGESVSSRSLDLQWVTNTLWSKNPRFMFILNQSCNKEHGDNTAREGNVLTETAPPFDLSSERYKDLYLRTKGYCILTSSKKGQYSYINGQGGFFMMGFLKALYDEVKSSNSRKSDWNRLVQNSISFTRETAELDYKSQEPIYGLDVSAASTLSTTGGGFTPSTTTTTPTVCSTCNNRGYYYSDVTCSNCSGYGKVSYTSSCSGCGGGGYVNENCGYCSGSGKYYTDCGYCTNGLANYKCTGCNGGGRVYCTGCRGTGVVTDYYGNRYRCSYCNGGGILTCAGCYGSGLVSNYCTACSGAGSFVSNCTGCRGYGQVSAKHYYCSGSGKVSSNSTCSSCSGKGKVSQKYTCSRH